MSVGLIEKVDRFGVSRGDERNKCHRGTLNQLSRVSGQAMSCEDQGLAEGASTVRFASSIMTPTPLRFVSWIFDERLGPVPAKQGI